MKICKSCGKEFQNLKGHYNYCDDCHNGVCACCGNPTKRVSGKLHKYCSRECEYTHKTYPKRKGIFKNCVLCGTEFYVCLCHSERMFCSHDCYSKDKLGKKYPERETGKIVQCLQCGVDVYKKKCHLDGRDNFCSRECLNIYQGRNKSHYICKICQKEFRASKSRKRIYCSLNCRDNDPDKKLQLINQNKELNKSIKPTKIEVIGYNLLTELNIHYDKQYMIDNKFCVDCFIQKYNLIIQFDGDYWHGYKADILNTEPRIKKRMQLDISQDEYAKKCGYKVLRLWEHDIKILTANKLSKLIEEIIKE